jgi:hypothetical protein
MLIPRSLSAGQRHGQTIWEDSAENNSRKKSPGRPRVLLLLLRSNVLRWWRDHRGCAGPFELPVHSQPQISEGMSYRHREHLWEPA